MEKQADELKIGEKFQPYISERTMKRVKKQFTVSKLPKYQKGSFSHFVLIECVNKKGEPDEVFIAGDEMVVVVE